MYKTIVFDLDGTLLDTLDDLTGAVNAALSSFSLPLRTREEVRSFIGNGVKKLMERASDGQKQEKAEEMLWAFKKHYAAHCADKTKPYDGILPLLTELKKQGKQLALLSNKADFAVKMLAEGYFKGVFDEVQGEDESNGVMRKPDPSALFAVLKRLNAKKENTVYIGDSEVDIQTAQNAGVDCVSVTWGFKEKAFLLENGAKKIADTPAELLTFCQKTR